MRGHMSGYVPYACGTEDNGMRGIYEGDTASSVYGDGELRLRSVPLFLSLPGRESAFPFSLPGFSFSFSVSARLLLFMYGRGNFPGVLRFLLSARGSGYGITVPGA